MYRLPIYLHAVTGNGKGAYIEVKLKR